MKWITRERPKIDRVACPWLIARFVDPTPEFLFAAADQVIPQSQSTGAIPIVPARHFARQSFRIIKNF